MVRTGRIIPPLGTGDSEGAQRVFEEFHAIYHPILMQLDFCLRDIIQESGPTFSSAYQPWQEALQQLESGIDAIVRHIPVIHTEKLSEALNMFCFDSSVMLLNDILVNRRFPVPDNWVEQFRDHIKLLLFSLSVLQAQEQASPA